MGTGEIRGYKGTVFKRASEANMYSPTPEPEGPGNPTTAQPPSVTEEAAVALAVPVITVATGKWGVNQQTPCLGRLRKPLQTPKCKQQ